MGKFERREPHGHVQRHRERSSAERQSDCGDRLLRQTASEETIDRCANQGQNRDQPQIEGRRHNFSKFTWSTFRVSRVRKTAMIMASPTVASAAATTITKNTKTCPLNFCQCAANATNERLTPFSISSIDMKIVMMLRLIKKPITPQVKRIPLSTR